MHSEKSDFGRRIDPLRSTTPAIIRAFFFVTIFFGNIARASCSAPQQQSPRPPDEMLWNAIEKIVDPADSSSNTSFDQRIQAAIRNKEMLIEKIQSYQHLYPGGTHFHSSVERELETLFELCTMLGDFARLESRLGQIDSQAADENTRAVAAWWRIHLFERSKPGVIPHMTGLFERDRRLVQAMAAFARHYPKSPLAIRATTLAAEDCIRRQEFDAANEWTRQLNEAAPESLAAIHLTGILRRADSVGKQLTGNLASIDGGPIDVASLRGSRVAMAFWNSAEDDSRQFAIEVQKLFGNRSDVRIVGVDLNPSLDDTRRLATSLELSWIQTNDRRGRGGKFIRHWGIEETPSLILLDGSGFIEVIAGPEKIASTLRGDGAADFPQSQSVRP